MVSPVGEDSSGDELNEVGKTLLALSESSTIDEQLVNPRPQREHTLTPMASILRQSETGGRLMAGSPGSIQGFMHDTVKSCLAASHNKLKDVQQKFDESQSRLEKAEFLLRKSEEDLKSLKDSYSKKCEVIHELNAKCIGNDLVIKELEEKLVKEKNKASAAVKAPKDSSRKKSEETQVLNGQIQEKDAVIRKLEEKVATLVNEKDSAYADGWQACTEEVDPMLRKLENDVMALMDSSRKDDNDRELLHRQYDEKILEIKKLEDSVAGLVKEKNTAYADGMQAQLVEIRPVLRKFEDDLKAFKESSCKESEERKVLNGQIEEKVEELVKEKNRAYADGWKAHSVEVEPMQRKLEKDLKALKESSGQELECQHVMIKELEKVVTELVMEKNKANADLRNQQHVPGERQGMVPHSWVAPADGIIKLNCSAAHIFGGTATGFGIVARDHTGQVLAWRQVLISGYIAPTLAEAYAVRESVLFATDKRWLKICIESDCKVLVDMLQYSMQQEQVDSNLVSPVVSEIVSLSAKFAFTEYGFVPRNCNSLARALARECSVSRDGVGEPN